MIPRCQSMPILASRHADVLSQIHFLLSWWLACALKPLRSTFSGRISWLWSGPFQHVHMPCTYDLFRNTLSIRDSCLFVFASLLHIMCVITFLVLPPLSIVSSALVPQVFARSLNPTVGNFAALIGFHSFDSNPNKHISGHRLHGPEHTRNLTCKIHPAPNHFPISDGVTIFTLRIS